MNEYCLAYECPLSEVSSELLEVCSDLGCSCDSCEHRCFGDSVFI